MLTLGLFSPEQWLQPRDLHKHAKSVDGDEHLRKTRMHIGVLAKGTDIIAALTLDDKLHDCLQTAITTGTFALQEECMKQWMREDDSNFVHEDEYFAYRSVSDAKAFGDIDACQAYTGDVSGVNPTNNVARSTLLWTANSINHVPLTERHVVSSQTAPDHAAESFKRW